MFFINDQVIIGTNERRVYFVEGFMGSDVIIKCGGRQAIRISARLINLV
jgi:hypothetical protein